MAYQMGYDFYGCEIDPKYFEAQQKRFEEECLLTFHTPSGKVIKELSLFDEV